MIEDEMELVGRLGEVDPLPAEVLEWAEVVLRGAMVTAKEPAPLRVEGRHRQRWARRRTLVGVAAAAVVVVGAAGGYLAAGSGSAGSRTKPLQAAPSHPASAVLTASRVRLISSQSAAAVADSGTGTEITTNTNNGSTQGVPTTVDVTFSGQNVNYAVGEGVQNRVVDGQLYLYVKGPDLQMHWYHDTAANAAASDTFLDPRTLLQAVSPSAGLENLGQVSVGGVELTHLRATTPGAIGQLGIPDIAGTVTSFDVWVDSDNVVRQMAVASSAGTAINCTEAAPGTTPKVPVNERVVTTLPSGKPVPAGEVCGYVTTGSTLTVQFANLGAPESVTVPSGATDEQGLG